MRTVLIKTSRTSRKVFRTILIALIISSWAYPALAAPPKKKKPTGGQQLYSSVWRKVQPAPKKKTLSSSSGAVAGLRGDEKAKFLRPYWKGEKKKPESPDTLAFRKAAKLMDASKFAEAEQVFLNIIVNFPKSVLLPRVKIALAICYAQQGKKGEAGRVLNDWLKAYTKHELATDVKAILAELKK